MRDSKLYLDDILVAIKKIEKYSQGITLQKLKNSDLLLDGITRNLEIIGEAVKNISPSIRAKYPNIEWKKIAGLRDILSHEYFGVDADVLWDIIQNKLPDLKQQVIIILKSI